MSTNNGTVKFFNTRKGFGFIEGEEGAADQAAQEGGQSSPRLNF